jgi:hypothetical protein
MGEIVGIGFDPARLHVFDGASGERRPDSAAPRTAALQADGLAT